jgi:hypothetical protein
MIMVKRMMSIMVILVTTNHKASFKAINELQGLNAINHLPPTTRAGTRRQQRPCDPSRSRLIRCRMVAY